MEQLKKVSIFETNDTEKISYQDEISNQVSVKPTPINIIDYTKIQIDSDIVEIAVQYSAQAFFYFIKIRNIIYTVYGESLTDRTRKPGSRQGRLVNISEISPKNTNPEIEKLIKTAIDVIAKPKAGPGYFVEYI